MLIYLLKQVRRDRQEKTNKQKQTKKHTERVKGFGRSTREEIVKWNQMTVLRFQTRRKHEEVISADRVILVGDLQLIMLDN